MKVTKNIMCLLYALGIMTFSAQIRPCYSRLYYWKDFSLANTLTDATYGRYGIDMYGRKWAIVTENWPTSDSFEELLDQYDIYDEYDVDVVCVDYMEQLAYTDWYNRQILYYNTEEECFQDMTDLYYGIMQRGQQ